MSHQSTASGETLFEPALYNEQELAFVMMHLGESPVIALHKGVPEGVSRAAIEDVLGRVYRFEEMWVAHQVPWCGRERLQECIFEYTEWMRQCAEIAYKGGPKHPSLYDWNSDGEGVRGATGSDGGTVRTMITPDGSRKRLALKMGSASSSISLEDGGAYVPDFARRTIAPTKFLEDTVRMLIECPICHHTENYKKSEPRSRNSARARMSRHCKTEKSESGRHRKLWNAEFASSKTERVEEMSSHVEEMAPSQE